MCVWRMPPYSDSWWAIPSHPIDQMTTEPMAWRNMQAAALLHIQWRATFHHCIYTQCLPLRHARALLLRHCARATFLNLLLAGDMNHYTGDYHTPPHTLPRRAHAPITFPFTVLHTHLPPNLTIDSVPSHPLGQLTRFGLGCLPTHYPSRFARSPRYHHYLVVCPYTWLPAGECCQQAGLCCGGVADGTQCSSQWVICYLVTVVKPCPCGQWWVMEEVEWGRSSLYC